MSIYNQMANTALQGYQQPDFMGPPQKNPFEGYDVTRLPMGQLEGLLKLFQEEVDRRTLDTPIPGPTKRQLLADETLNRAWSEYQVIAKLKGIK